MGWKKGLSAIDAIPDTTNHSLSAKGGFLLRGGFTSEQRTAEN